jgi:hypothetical protein
MNRLDATAGLEEEVMSIAVALPLLPSAGLPAAALESRQVFYCSLLANLRTSLSTQHKRRDVRLHGARTRTRRRMAESTTGSEPGFKAFLAALKGEPE